MNLQAPNFVKYLKLTHILSDVPMLSILSAKTLASRSIFRLLKIFEYKIWLIFWLLYFALTVLCYYVPSTPDVVNHKHKVFIVFIGIIFKQSVQTLKRTDTTAPIVMIWYLTTFIVISAFSGALLSFLVVAKPYNKIDSIADLAKSDIKFIIFDGETSVEYFNDTSEPLFGHFFNRSIVENPENNKQKEWELEVFQKINDGERAIVSDQLFLDFYFATKAQNYTNLYRSVDNQLVLPYFMPVTHHNSPLTEFCINLIIEHLLESGIYEMWVKETIFKNIKDRNRYSKFDYLTDKYMC
ncbi:unnamed protein product, partial [Medioppia subpectinata]